MKKEKRKREKRKRKNISKIPRVGNAKILRHAGEREREREREEHEERKYLQISRTVGKVAVLN